MSTPSSTPPLSLVPLLTLVWFGNWGTSIGWSAVYFLAEERHGFGPRTNALLGLGAGLAYTVIALAAGPAARWAAGHRVSRRRLLGISIAALAVSAVVPVVFREPWSIWVFALTYIPIQGVMWPIVEAYVSGGRTGRTQRSAVGQFNIVWSSAIPVAMWFVALTIERAPEASFGALAIAQVVMLIVLRWFPTEPARSSAHHMTEGDVIDPVTGAHYSRPRITRLLHASRGANMFGYVLLAALGPLLPTLIGRVGLDAGAKTLLASVWMATRVIAFATMQRWHGWHGRWVTTVVSVALLGTGVGLVLLSGSWVGIAIGLALFGLGSGVAYSAAIAYALELEEAEVDAGGKHEAVMGVGYAVGPLVALAIAPLVAPGGASGR